MPVISASVNVEVALGQRWAVRPGTEDGPSRRVVRYPAASTAMISCGFLKADRQKVFALLSAACGAELALMSPEG